MELRLGVVARRFDLWIELQRAAPGHRLGEPITDLVGDRLERARGNALFVLRDIAGDKTIVAVLFGVGQDLGDVADLLAEGGPYLRGIGLRLVVLASTLDSPAPL